MTEVHDQIFNVVKIRGGHNFNWTLIRFRNDESPVEIYVNFNRDHLTHNEPKDLDHKKVIEDITQKLEEEDIPECNFDDEINTYSDGSEEIVRGFSLQVSDTICLLLKIKYTMRL